MQEIQEKGDSIPGWGRRPGGGHHNPLQCSCLENPMDRGALQATVYGVAKQSDTTEQLSTHGGGQSMDSGGRMNCVLKEAYYVWGNVLGILFLNFYLLIYFLAVLGLSGCMQAFSVCGKRCYFLIVVC